MNVRQCLTWAVDPAMDWLSEHGVPCSDEARLFLLAVAGQESGLASRFQRPSGAARGLWQFEPIGVRGVLEHRRTGTLLRNLCADALVVPTAYSIHDAIEHHDQLAAALARLLLLTDPAPLPATQADAWAAYLRCWRPGKPRLESWPRCWADACGAVALRRWTPPDALSGALA